MTWQHWWRNKYRGQFEERMKAIMNELEKTLISFCLLMKYIPLLAQAELPVRWMLPTCLNLPLPVAKYNASVRQHLDEYRQYIEKDGALDRRFQKVIVEPTSPEETIQILNNIKSKYEEHHNVTYTEDAIEACVYLTTRYITDRLFTR